MLKRKHQQHHWQRQRQTTNKSLSEKLIWAFVSGELKRKIKTSRHTKQDVFVFALLWKKICLISPWKLNIVHVYVLSIYVISLSVVIFHIKYIANMFFFPVIYFSLHFKISKKQDVHIEFVCIIVSQINFWGLPKVIKYIW